ncbi:hypothetical protein HXX76_010807 [Chlamydomonas incerta]|uniref:SnoaL-like domain-containing protein n=1 Tax=Chlamydomonas incerta TaxID=51695 RepID=A0A835SQP2_CHLIN|nr:hypothetical protein HXX76_010807 [Chlamydomonas incerta]|eukprot:KAG2429572.1 hypothetical protein HXX76_010807 [Chlamydomonas incerta]
MRRHATTLSRARTLGAPSPATCRTALRGSVAVVATTPIAASRRGSSRYSRGGGGSSTTGRGRLQVVAYRSELSDMLLQARAADCRAHRYAELTAAAGSMTREELATALGPLVGPRGVAFLADGVIYRRDRTRDVGQLVDALTRQHRAYEHLVYRPVVSAVNEEQGVVFSAVCFVVRNREPLFGAREATGRISQGFLIDKQSYDKRSGALVSSLVTRQLTLEERDALLPDPTAWQPTAVEEAELTAVPDVVAGPADHAYMRQIIGKWAGVWSSRSSRSSLDVLPQVLAPDVCAYDGYGLCNKPNGVLWQGPNEARAVIAATHDRYDNCNQLVSYAVSFEHKLGFHHWRANATDRGTERLEPIEGVGLIAFNKHLQIQRIYEFDMKPYPLRSPEEVAAAAAGGGGGGGYLV